MPHLVQTVAVLRRVLLATLVTGAFAGCTSSRSVDEIASDRASVLGTWEYRTDGIPRLHRGRLHITVQNGRLKGRLQDRWRGTVEARVQLHGSRMELDLDRILISGRVREDRFVGSVRTSMGTVTTNRRSASGVFIAKRVRRSTDSGSTDDFGCPSLLYEGSYACSPFQRGR